MTALWADEITDADIAAEIDEADPTPTHPLAEYRSEAEATEGSASTPLPTSGNEEAGACEDCGAADHRGRCGRMPVSRS